MEELIDLDNIEQEISIEKSNEKHYLQELYERLHHLKENDKTVSFVIKEPAKKGFLIKVGGLFGFIQFRLFPIYYRNNEIWKVVSPLFIGHKFYGKIKSLNRSPLNVELFGKVHLFETLQLELDKPYKAIVVHKKDFGMNIELGNYFDWKYGSILGFVHKLSFKDVCNFENLKVGDEITTFFQKQSFDKNPVFGELSEEKSNDLSELERFVGTIQKVILRIDENGYRHYKFDDRFYGTIPVVGIYYGNKNQRQKVRDFLKTMITGSELNCEVISILAKKRKFILKVKDVNID